MQQPNDPRMITSASPLTQVKNGLPQETGTVGLYALCNDFKTTSAENTPHNNMKQWRSESSVPDVYSSLECFEGQTQSLRNTAEKMVERPHGFTNENDIKLDHSSTSQIDVCCKNSIPSLEISGTSLAKVHLEDKGSQTYESSTEMIYCGPQDSKKSRNTLGTIKRFPENGNGVQGIQVDKILLLCNKARAIFNGEADIWAGYDPANEDIPIVVAIVDKICETAPKQIDNYTLLQRQSHAVSQEAEICLKREKSINYSADDLSRLHACLSKHSQILFQQHSNLQIISASKIKCSGYKFNNDENMLFKNTVSVVLYVHIKGIIPVGETIFPSELDGFPVDVREGCFLTYMLPEESEPKYHKNLAIGCHFVNGYKMSGSIGGFVQLPNKSVGCLTCWHIFLTLESHLELNKDVLNHSDFKRDVYQPYPSFEKNYKFGNVVRATYREGSEGDVGVDAVLIEITDKNREPQNWHFPDEGDRTVELFEGEIVKTFEELYKFRRNTLVKYGAQTRLTTGNLNATGAAVKKWNPNDQPNENIRLYQQIEIFPEGNDPKNIFASEGDSGSLIFALLENTEYGEGTRAIGILVGGTTYGSAIVTPIWEILESFDLPLKLLTFNEHSIRNLNRDMRDVKKELSNIKSELCRLSGKIDSLIGLFESLQNNT